MKLIQILDSGKVPGIERTCPITGTSAILISDDLFKLLKFNKVNYYEVASFKTEFIASNTDYMYNAFNMVTENKCKELYTNPNNFQLYITEMVDTVAKIKTPNSSCFYYVKEDDITLVKGTEATCTGMTFITKGSDPYILLTQFPYKSIEGFKANGTYPWMRDYGFAEADIDYKVLNKATIIDIIDKLLVNTNANSDEVITMEILKTAIDSIQEKIDNIEEVYTVDSIKIYGLNMESPLKKAKNEYETYETLKLKQGADLTITSYELPLRKIYNDLMTADAKYAKLLINTPTV